MSDRSALTQREISNGRGWLPGLPVDTPGSGDFPSTAQPSQTKDAVEKYSNVYCRSKSSTVQVFISYLLGSEWIKTRSMRPFLPSPCMPHVEVAALDVDMLAERCTCMLPVWDRCLTGANVWRGGGLAGDWAPAQGHLGGPRKSRLGQKQTYLCHSSALELDPTLVLAAEYS